MSVEPDTRIHVVDTDRRVVEPALAERFPGLRVLTPRSAWVTGHLSLQARPETRATLVTEALHGEALELLEELNCGWAWVRTLHDGYLGYVHLQAGEVSDAAPERPVTVTVPRTFLFAAPSIKSEVLSRPGRGASFTALEPAAVHFGDYRWWRVAYRGQDAYLHAAATIPLKPDVGTFTAAYLHTPYLWGGRSAWGLDCSGLAQLWAGKDAAGQSRLPRDADQQQTATQPVEMPLAGDLAFFPGHVGIMLGERRMLHANATHLAVTVETLGEGHYGQKLLAELLGYGRIPGRL